MQLSLREFDGCLRVCCCCTARLGVRDDAQTRVLGNWLTQSKGAVIQINQAADGTLRRRVVGGNEPGGKYDTNNPDPARRKLPLRGQVIISGLKHDGGGKGPAAPSTSRTKARATSARWRNHPTRGCSSPVTSAGTLPCKVTEWQTRTRRARASPARQARHSAPQEKRTTMRLWSLHPKYLDPPGLGCPVARGTASPGRSQGEDEGVHQALPARSVSTAPFTAGRNRGIPASRPRGGGDARLSF